MKTLDLKKTKLENGQEVTFKDLALAVIAHQPQGGLDIEEIDSRLRLKKALKEAGEILELEDADADKLKALTRAMRWGSSEEVISEFHHAVLAL